MMNSIKHQQYFCLHIGRKKLLLEADGEVASLDVGSLDGVAGVASWGMMLGSSTVT